MNHLAVLACLPLFVLPAGAVAAQSALSRCIAIETDAERLACYDGLFQQQAGATPLNAVLESEQLIPARPTGRARATMTVSCAAGDLTIGFAFAGNTLSALGNDVGLTLQNDLQAARSRTLPVDASNTAVLIEDSGEAEAFLAGLEGATNLTARITPVNSRSLSVRFRVDSFADEVAPVRAACAG